MKNLRPQEQNLNGEDTSQECLGSPEAKLQRDGNRSKDDFLVSSRVQPK